MVLKSSDSQLKSRGKITFEDLQHYNNHSKLELLEMIKSKEAYKRTIAIKKTYDLTMNTVKSYVMTS
ncbi:hypothetical protein COL41_09390 [Bacillus mycoides]|uniref:hypothetical protein n=1 Tax=Bacillus mycoides TaxID=1405 RepID=UPI000BF37F3D|nr:hypothetical protein [Bacillus mycoides]PFX96325.1 hypothetical protein COL41_09390 [Bacillus mycoides]